MKRTDCTFEKGTGMQKQNDKPEIHFTLSAQTLATAILGKMQVIQPQVNVWSTNSGDTLKKYKKIIWILVEHLISRWTLSTSQWQLNHYHLCVCTVVICNSERVTSFKFNTACCEYPLALMWVQHCLFATWLVPRETAAVSYQFIWEENKKTLELKIFKAKSER